MPAFSRSEKKSSGVEPVYLDGASADQPSGFVRVNNNENNIQFNI